MTKNYTYGIPWVSGEVRQVLHDAAWRAHLYRNVLVGIERVRRASFRALRSELSPDLANLEAEVDTVNASIEEAYVRLSRVRDPKRPGMSLSRSERATDATALAIVAEIEASKAARKSLWCSIGEMRKNVYKEHFASGVADAKAAKQRGLLEAIAGDLRKTELVRADARRALSGEMSPKDAAAFVTANLGPRHASRVDVAASLALRSGGGVHGRLHRIESDAHAARKQARAECGIGHGTYIAVENAAEKSFAECTGDPLFAHYAGSGAVGAQMRAGGISVDEAFAGARSQFSLKVDGSLRLRGGRSAASAKIQLEAGVVIEVPIVLHRPLPKDGVVRWVYVDIRRVGLRTIYSLRLTVSSGEERPVAEGGLLAINFGWRAMEDGSVRVATTWDGVRHDEVRIPAKMRDDAGYVRETLGRSDVIFDDARAVFADWIATSQADLSAVDEQVRGLWPTVRQWRSHGKLARAAIALRSVLIGEDRARELWAAWRAYRMARRTGGVELFGSWGEIDAWLEGRGLNRDVRVAVYLDWWRAKDRHLTDVARGIERRLVLRRREIYRVAAASWVRRYARVAIEQWDKRDTAQSPAPEQDARGAQEVAAASIRQLVGVSVLAEEIAERFGKRLVKANPRGISRHFGCGGEGDRLPSYMVSCARCGVKYDQDRDASRALYERSGGASDPGGAREENLAQFAAE